MLKEFVVQMREEYPFGQLGQTLAQGTRTLVKKTLHYQNQEEYERIKQMVYFLKAAKHEHLVNVDRMLEGQGYIELYYEYVPMRVQKWVAEVNEELVGALQLQLVELCEYLTHCSLKFSFDCNCVGLTSEMTVKYFLNEFTVDLQNQQDNSNFLKQQIRQFFKELCAEAEERQQQAYNRLSVQSQQSKRFQSLSTNASIEPIMSLNRSSDCIKVREGSGQATKRKALLAQMAEDSMKKSLLVLQRFKRMSQK